MEKQTLDSAYVYIKYKAIPINHIYLHMHYYVVQLVDVIAVETKYFQSRLKCQKKKV